MDSTDSKLSLTGRFLHRFQNLREFSGDERGATAIEYSLMASLIAIACIGGISATGTSVTALYEDWTAKVIEVLKG